jgi:hypothetical protein
VLVRGKRAPTAARVHEHVHGRRDRHPGAGLEDESVLGRQGDERITAEQLAAWRGTIAYRSSRISLPRRRVIPSKGIRVVEERLSLFPRGDDEGAFALVKLPRQRDRSRRLS